MASVYDLVHEMLDTMDPKDLTMDQLIEAAKALSSDELEELKLALEDQEGPAKLEKLSHDIAGNIQRLLEKEPATDILEPVLDAAETLASELEEALSGLEEEPDVPRTFSKTVARAVAEDHLQENSFIRASEQEMDFIGRLQFPHSRLAAAHAATDPEEERRILAEQGIWKTHKGELVKVKDMNDQHLVNSAKMLQRKAVERIARQYDEDPEDLDETMAAETIYGGQYSMLIREIADRGLEGEL